MNDPEIRALLRPLLVGGTQIEELPCGTTRADLVHITSDFMHGYELKGSGDSLKRATNQLYCYSRAYDYVTFVVTPMHLAGLLAILPKWAGVMIAESDGITPYRAAGHNPQMSRAYVISLLRQAEIKTFLKQQGIAGCSKMRGWELVAFLKNADHIPLAAVATYTRERLVARLDERMKQREALRDARKRDRENDRERKLILDKAFAKPSEAQNPYTIEGFANYEADAAGGVWHLRHSDASGHIRQGKQLRLANNGGTLGFFLRRNGCPVWVGLRQLRTLLVRA